MRKAVLVLIAAALLAHAGIFRCGWHLDDNHTIVGNEKIGDLEAAARGALLANRGIGNLTFTLNWLLTGPRTFSYHIVNLLIHLGNGLLVMLLARRLAAGAPRRDLIAAGAGALFLLHPLSTNSVTYVVQRYTSLATLFYLLSVVSYLRGREGSTAARVLSVAAALGAARTKEIALTLPLVLAFTELLYPRGRGARRFLRVLPHVAAVSVIPATLLAGHLGIGESLSEAMRAGSRETAEVGRLPYLLTQIRVVPAYLRLLFLPYGLSLDHDFPVTESLDASTLAHGLLLAGIGAAAYLARRRFRLAAYGAGWFALALLVESSVFPIRDVIFEHRTYLPSVGVFLAILGVAAAAVPSRRLLIASLVSVSLVLGALTALRNRVWVDDVALWTDCVRKAPGKARPYANLGYAWIDRGEKARARGALETAIRLGPPFPEDLVTLAELHFAEGELGRSEETLREALRLRPDYGRARRNLAQVLLEKGEEDAALREAEEAVLRDPEYESGWVFLARLRLLSGDAEGSLVAAAEAGRRGGEAEEVALLLAMGEAARGNGPAALRHVRQWSSTGSGGKEEDLASLVRSLVEGGSGAEAAEAARLGSRRFPEDSRFPYYEGAILLAEGRPAEGAAALEEALRRDPEDTIVRGLLALSWARAGRPGEAEREARAVLRLDPGNPDARAALAEIGLPETPLD
ncbi:MAG: tetratricopeptide repeat protein [Candidatus Eisenbacteria bacterium]